jgi:dUTP pyrophosphatase
MSTLERIGGPMKRSDLVSLAEDTVMDVVESCAKMTKQANAIAVQRIDSRAILPVRKNPGDAGLDLSPIEGGMVGPGECRRFSTGLKIAIPNGTVGRIVPRSSRFWEGWYIDGTLDGGYRGEILLQMRNVSKDALWVVPGERYAQLVVCEICLGEVNEVESLDQTVRGEGGWGSTGK